MTKFYMLVGLPASGKSTMAKEISEKENVVIVSSDEIRERLLGDRGDQSKQGLIFDEMLRLTLAYLRNGFSVIYDATNINSKRRKALLSKLPKEVHKCCIYLDINKEECIKRNAKRIHTVPEHVINKMNNAMQIPTYHEGWDCIK